MRKFFFVVLTMLLLALPAMAQDDSRSVYLRAAHFSVDAPEVDVYVNGELALEAFDFPDVSNWMELEAGTHTVDIVPTGGAIEDVVLSGDYDLSAGDWATLAVIGEAGRDTLAIQAIIDNLNNIPDGLTFVSAFHAITDLDPVNVFVGDTELVRLLSYPGTIADTDGYVSDTIVAGDYDFDIQAEDSTSLLSVDTSTLGAGRAYFLAAVGTAENPLFVFIPTDVESITMTEMDSFAGIEIGEGSLLARLGHFSVSAPAVDIYVNGELSLENVEFGDLTDYREFEAGIYEVALVPAGEALENATYEGQIALVADSLTLVAAIGFVGDDSLQVVTATENNVAPEANFSRIAYFHAIPGTELYDLSANDNILIQGVTYPDVFEGAGDGYAPVDIVAGDYNFVAEGAGNTLNIGNVTTGSGRVYLIVSAGTENDPLFFLFPGDFPSGE